MPGPVPKDPSARINRNKPLRGEWKASAGVGWQHGETPKPPTGILRETRDAWTTWMGSWFAAHWTPDDLPALRYVATLFDRCSRPPIMGVPPYAELRQMMDNYGITPKGQQDRRWAPPKAEPVLVSTGAADEVASPYVGLRVVAG